MASYVKAQLKASREALSAKDCEAALQAADNVLNYEHDNYNALVFRGLALLGLKKYTEAEAAYRKATQVKPEELLAWQGLEKYYIEQHKPDQAIEIIQELLKRHSQDATKTAEALQRILELRRKEDDKQKVGFADASGVALMTDRRCFSWPMHWPISCPPRRTTIYSVRFPSRISPLQWRRQHLKRK